MTHANQTREKWGRLKATLDAKARGCKPKTGRRKMDAEGLADLTDLAYAMDRMLEDAPRL